MLETPAFKYGVPFPLSPLPLPLLHKRVKNLGNFQSESFEAVATVDEGEEAHIVAEVLKIFVLKELGLYQPEITDDDIPVGF